MLIRHAMLLSTSIFVHLCSPHLCRVEADVVQWLSPILQKENKFKQCCQSKREATVLVASMVQRSLPRE
jgi:hypothetical protein